MTSLVNLHWLTLPGKFEPVITDSTKLKLLFLSHACTRSLFGRMYYEGTSVQNINKELRRAVLGNCFEYDIRSSVVAWKMGWAKQYIDAYGQGKDLRKVFSATLNFLEDKADFMGTVQYFTFGDDSCHLQM